MSLADLDVGFLKLITSLHSNDHLLTGEPSALQASLEEAIKAKTGVIKDFTPLIATSVKQQRLDEFKSAVIIEDSKTSSSDNELELDLLKEDLMCVVCNGMDVGARNRLLECSDCHALYHQECHRPVVTLQESDDNWICQNCKEASKKFKRSPSNASPITVTSNPTVVKPIPSKIPTAVQHAVPVPTLHIKSATKHISTKISSTLNSKPPTVLKVSNETVARATIAPNINILTVDKRIQIMKKRAAKLQEKRKQLSR